MNAIKTLAVLTALLAAITSCQNGITAPEETPASQTVQTDTRTAFTMPGFNFSDMYHRYQYVNQGSRITYVLPIRVKLEKLTSYPYYNNYKVTFSYWAEGNMRRMIVADTCMVFPNINFTANGKNCLLYYNDSFQLCLKIYQNSTYWAEYETRVKDGVIF